MDNYEFINTALRITTEIPTMYYLGGWGQQQNGYYLFDCVCLIKSILWGFNFSVGGHGGAIYLANGVPDVNADRMIELCTNISYDFSNIEIGEILWLDGHVGIYVGDRNVVEATAAWENKVLISYVETNGVRIRNGHQVYRWIKHGKFPYIIYNSGYATILNFGVEDITTNSVKIVFTTNLPIIEALYSLDGTEYYSFPADNILHDLTPYTNYKVRIKVKRIYTDNWTESNVIDFMTLDEPISLKYKVDDIVIVNGNLYVSSNGDDIIKVLDNYKGIITDVDNHYGTIHPYYIDDMGWVDEANIKLYTQPDFNIIDFIKNILSFILRFIFIPLVFFFFIILLIIIFF